jgi:hypothetical protein
MRAISGSTWGATTKALLTIYKALIRSVIDYGDIAYDSAANSHLEKLDRIQSHALKISAGAMKSTAIDALQVELDEPPLSLRRLKHQIEFGIKANTTQNHPAISAAIDHWTVHYGHYSRNNKPLLQKITPFIEAHDLTKVEQPKRGSTPPWKLKPANIDDSLHAELNNKEAPIPLLALAKLKIHNYKDSTAIYTDASKTSDGRVGVGVYVDDPDHNLTDSLSLRISENTSVFTGEMTAIKIALQFIGSVNKETQINNFTIYTDSLSSTQAISSKSCFAQPNL